jgi:hypothetical protein
MVSSASQTVREYLASLPADRRKVIATVRKVILDHLPAGFEESMGFGMITYAVPLSRYPDTYNKQPLQLAALASQKQSMSLYLMTVYGHPDVRRRFEAAWKKTGKKLDMGKSCIRFRSLDDLALDAVAEVIGATTVDAYVAHYESVRDTTTTKRSTTKSRSRTGKAARSG